MTTLKSLLSSDRPDLPAVTAHLDSLEPAARLAEVRSLGSAEQSRLYDAARGYRRIDLAHFVPPGLPPLAEVVHDGKNNLPAFSLFAKVFCHPDGDRAGAPDLWGYNRGSALVETAVGPGYFVARPHGDGEVVIDYLEVPPRRPGGWPPILPNSARLSRFVYYRTQDFMRGVSEHVSIGHATRDGKDLPNWFVLCRRV